MSIQFVIIFEFFPTLLTAEVHFNFVDLGLMIIQSSLTEEHLITVVTLDVLLQF